MIARRTSVELVVIEVGHDLLRVRHSVFLEYRETLWIGRSKVVLDIPKIVFEMDEVRLLVECGRLEVERVNNIVDLRGTLLESLVLSI